MKWLILIAFYTAGIVAIYLASRALGVMLAGAFVQVGTPPEWTWLVGSILSLLVGLGVYGALKPRIKNLADSFEKD